MKKFIRMVAPCAMALALVGGHVQAAPAAGERTYKNPVIKGFSSDPSICRVGNDYYLVASTFIYFPGVPIFHSKDLVNWRQIGNALTRTSQLPLENQGNSRGIFAPTLRCQNGKFYLITTNISNGGNFIAVASDPAGPWSEVTWLKDGGGMDPSLFFDDDGKIYYTRHGGGERGGAYQAELDPATLKVKDTPRLIWKGTGGIWPEGPHLYKREGWYYLLQSEGGTSYDHSMTVARSKSPWGPFEANPKNPIITHKHNPELPLQAIGHGDLVQTPEGNWWMVLLGVRPHERNHHIGRETVLAPVTWSADGWPVVNQEKPLQMVMSDKGLPAAHPWPATPEVDEFNRTDLGVEWYSLRAPANALYSLTEKPGVLRLKGSRDQLSTITTPAFVGYRQRDLDMHASTALSFDPAAAGQTAGLVIRQDEQNHYVAAIVKKDGKRRVELTSVVKGKATILKELDVPAGEVVLAVDAKPAAYTFSAVAGGKKLELGSLPTAPLSSEKAGGFTGVYIGLYATNQADAPMPPADFAWFKYQGKD